MTIQLANNAVTVLDADINSGVTSITVYDGSVFPSSGDFYIVIDAEIIKVTARSSNTLTVVRGQESTTATAHNLGARVAQVLTKKTLEDWHGDRIIYDTFANRPAAGVNGRLFLGSNTPIVSYDNGSAWFSRVFGIPITEFSDSGFGWINQGSATLTTTQGYAVLKGPASGSINLRIRKKTAPAAPYTITTFFNFICKNSNFASAGILWRESGSSKLVWLNVDSTGQIFLGKYNTDTSFNSLYTLSDDISWSNNVPGYFMRIADNNTNRICSVSVDGQNWLDIHTVSRTDFITADEVGFAVNNENSASVQMALYSWLQA